jgi:hypothetical protein
MQYALGSSLVGVFTSAENLSASASLPREASALAVAKPKDVIPA